MDITSLVLRSGSKKRDRSCVSQLEGSSWPSRPKEGNLSKSSSSYGSTNSMEPIASGANHHTSENSAAYFHWTPSSRLHGIAEERAAYFGGLQKDLHVHDNEHILEPPTDVQISPNGPQASTLLDLMTIRAFHSKLLWQFSLGTAIGFRTREGILTDIPAIIVFVARKVHKEWLHEVQWLPPVLEVCWVITFSFLVLWI